jgi:hypothetical protein
VRRDLARLLTRFCSSERAASRSLPHRHDAVAEIGDAIVEGRPRQTPSASSPTSRQIIVGSALCDTSVWRRFRGERNAITSGPSSTIISSQLLPGGVCQPIAVPPNIQ